MDYIFTSGIADARSNGVAARQPKNLKKGFQMSNWIEKSSVLLFIAVVGGLLWWESQSTVVAAPVDEPARDGFASLQPEDQPKGKDDRDKSKDKKDKKKGDKEKDEEEWEDYVPEEEPQDQGKYAPKIRRLTKEEISRIRFMEMNAMRNVNDVESISVDLSRNLAQDFLLEMSGHEDFRDEATQREFMTLTPAQKVHYIAKYTGPKFADRVEIRTDPEIFSEFRRNVLPFILRGCATGGCHNSLSKEAYGFRLFNDPKRSPATMYANFIVLNDFANESGMLINRNAPQNSLLANYLLEADQVSVENRHPGDVKYRPPFKNRKNPRFKRILDWMGSLKIPAEDYGVRLLPKYEPEKSIFDDDEKEGDKPDEKGDDADKKEDGSDKPSRNPPD